MKGLDNLAGLVKAVGLSNKCQEKHNTSKSPYGSRFYRLSLRIHRKLSVVSGAKEGLFEAFKKDWTIAWSNSVTFTLSKQADSKQSTTARSSILRLGDSQLQEHCSNYTVLNGSEAPGGCRTVKSYY